jgi:hypothetical protein
MLSIESRTRKVTIQRIGFATLALAALLAGIAGAESFRDTADSGAGGSLAAVRVSRTVARDVPAVTARPARAWQQDDIRFFEQNTQLPGSVDQRVPSLAEVLFLEMNTLPDTSEPHYPGQGSPHVSDSAPY